jgi:hypothetical protein
MKLEAKMEMRTAGGGRISRRRALVLGGGVAGGILAAGMPGGAQALAGARARGAHAAASGPLPVAAIERIVQAKGTVSGGVLDIGLDRDDIGDVKGPLGVTFTPSFQINGNLFFQPLGHGRALAHEIRLGLNHTNSE